MRWSLAWWLVGDGGRDSMVELNMSVVGASNGVVVSSFGMSQGITEDQETKTFQYHTV